MLDYLRQFMPLRYTLNAGTLIEDGDCILTGHTGLMPYANPCRSIKIKFQELIPMIGIDFRVQGEHRKKSIH